jgi:hypothetical protein
VAIAYDQFLFPSLGACPSFLELKERWLQGRDTTPYKVRAQTKES